MIPRHGFISDVEHERFCRYHKKRLTREDPYHAVYQCPRCKMQTCYCSGGSDNSICDICNDELRLLGWSADRISEEYPP